MMMIKTPEQFARDQVDINLFLFDEMGIFWIGWPVWIVKKELLLEITSFVTLCTNLTTKLQIEKQLNKYWFSMSLSSRIP